MADEITKKGNNEEEKKVPVKRTPFKRVRKPRFEKKEQEFEQKIIDIRRLARVTAGGRRFSFGVVVLLGDKKGRVGLGIGKASDTSYAIEKAIRNAKKNLKRLKTTKEMSIPYEVKAKFNSARVMIMPNRGKGIVAGSAMRDIINLAGLKNITAKVISRSKNKLNIARATVKALSEL